MNKKYILSLFVLLISAQAWSTGFQSITCREIYTAERNLSRDDGPAMIGSMDFSLLRQSSGYYALNIRGDKRGVTLVDYRNNALACEYLQAAPPFRATWQIQCSGRDVSLQIDPQTMRRRFFNKADNSYEYEDDSGININLVQGNSKYTDFIWNDACRFN